MITITDSAQKKLQEIMKEEPAGSKLRMYIQGGGCSGFSYGFSIETEQNEDDFIIEAGSTKIMIDSMSSQYLQGAEVDFTDDLMGSNFKIRNPNAQTTCGCGSSFNPY